MLKEFCPYCEKVSDVSLNAKRETLPVLGEPVEYDARVYTCSACQNDFAPSALEKENFKTAYDIYRKRHGLLTPEKIRQIREMYGLTQKQFSIFLGWGEITIHRYEAGAIQDKVHNETLALLDDPKNAMRVLELNRNDLDPAFVLTLEKKISDLIEQKTYETCAGLVAKTIPGAYVDKTFSGNRPFDMVRLENLVLYVLDKCNGVVKTKLNKLLWYCDFKNYKETGVSITGSSYVHLPHGPVPDNYESLLWQLSKQNKVTIREIVLGNYTGEEYYANQAPAKDVFMAAELQNIDYVLNRLGRMNAKEIRDYSHEEAGYKDTGHLDFIPYSFAATLSI